MILARYFECDQNGACSNLELSSGRISPRVTVHSLRFKAMRPGKLSGALYNPLKCPVPIGCGSQSKYSTHPACNASRKFNLCVFFERRPLRLQCFTSETSHFLPGRFEHTKHLQHIVCANNVQSHDHEHLPHQNTTYLHDGHCPV